MKISGIRIMTMMTPICAKGTNPDLEDLALPCDVGLRLKAISSTREIFDVGIVAVINAA